MYLSNPYLYEAITHVVDMCSVDNEQKKVKKVPTDCLELVTHRIILKDSLFHPQGGGQPSDKGKIIADNGDIFHVLFAISTSKSSSKIIEHYGYISSSSESRRVDTDASIAVRVDTDASITVRVDTDASIAETSNLQIESNESDNLSTKLSELKLDFFSIDIEVHMHIDQACRKLYSRLHSAGHTIDSALKRCDSDIFYRLKATKGYHFIDGPYVEYEGNLTDKEMKETLSILNESLKDIVNEDILTVIYLIKKEEASVLLGISESELEFYPESIRVVSIAGHPIACGGTHVNSTKDLESVTITKIKKKKNIVKISYIL